jgi:signal transduction histidine kinase
MKKVKILVVDDLPENLLVLQALLERDDLEILEARSGTEALELLLVHDVALALVDVQMPEMDGFELAELMRGSERTAGVPIIFVTAGARETNRIFQGYDAGAVDFLFKPVEPKILAHKVNTFVQLHRQKQRVEELHDQLAETLRLNETFVAAVGHDLRNPLNAIIMMSDLLAHKIEEPAQKRQCERLRSSARRMSVMIDELFDLARVRRNGGLEVRRTRFDLAAVAERIVHELQPGEERTIDIATRGDTQGEWDEGRIAQLLSNLVGNALRHGTAGTPVVITLDGTSRDVRVEVRNAGEIPSDQLRTLFDPYRARGARGGQGLGLGLFIVDHIVKAHGGSVEVTAESGSTIARVTLPRSA